jgi:hypothetical protein
MAADPIQFATDHMNVSDADPRIFRHRGHGVRRRSRRQMPSSVNSTPVSVRSVSRDPIRPRIFSRMARMVADSEVSKPIHLRVSSRTSRLKTPIRILHRGRGDQTGAHGEGTDPIPELERRHFRMSADSRPLAVKNSDLDFTGGNGGGREPLVLKRLKRWFVGVAA